MAEPIITDALVEQFKTLDVCCVSDAMDRMGVPCALYGIKPVNNDVIMCGRAFTVHYVPCGIVKGTVGDFLDDIKAGEVAVIDNAGRDYCTVWGDLMTIAASRNGLAGTVIDGVCRDVPVVRKLKYPIFSRGYYMATGKDRVEVDAVNISVSISGIRVNPGDLIMGDDSGVIAIPQELIVQCLEAALDIAGKEDEIAKAILEGKSLKEARSKGAYHKLQTKKV
jgi:regulator of RNase E activity RraA